MTESVAEAGLWLTQGEAAAALGWHIERLRAAAKRGKLQRRKNNQGQWLVLVTPELAKPGAAPGHAPDGGAAMAQAALEHALGSHGAEVGQLHEELAELRNELAEERTGRARAEGELAGLREALVRADAERDREIARADRLETELARLAAELAEASKGWLERLIEAIRHRRVAG